MPLKPADWDRWQLVPSLFFLEFPFLCKVIGFESEHKLDLWFGLLFTEMALIVYRCCTQTPHPHPIRRLTIKLVSLLEVVKRSESFHLIERHSCLSVIFKNYYFLFSVFFFLGMFGRINVLGQLATFHSFPIRQAVSPCPSCSLSLSFPLAHSVSPPATLFHLLICLSKETPRPSFYSRQCLHPLPLLNSRTSFNLYLLPPSLAFLPIL